MEVIRRHKESGGSVAAVFPIHYPRALFRAFNILPVEVWGPPGVDPSHGDKRLQAYVCSIVRNGLAFLESGGLDVVDILVTPHACDSLQGFGSLLIDFVPTKQPVLPLYMPRSVRASDLDFLAAELGHLFQRLEAFTGISPSGDQLMESIHREEAADVILGGLHQARQKLPLTDLPFYRLVRSREYLPAELFIETGQKALSQAEGEGQPGIPIILSGILPEPMEMLEAITDMGGCVAADDLACCGRRLYPAGSSQDPLRRMAERILNAPPDPTRGNPINERVSYLKQLVDETGAKGIVFYDVKFCEPELFDLPDLRRSLQGANIPSIVIEVDINDPLSHQVITRLESFLEMIE
jgi:benzoyl-CoA reductase/2-hydroxyglutaryl-CoA dehydratase subunit BcrC/BadD/HgdB